MDTQSLLLGLNSVNMCSDQESEEGFYWVNSHKSQNNPYIRIALEAAMKYDVKAVYFRFFHNGRPPIPQIYIFDFTIKKFNKDKFSDTHKRIWNSIQVPLIYVFLKTEILIFNSYSPEFKNNNSLSFYEKISLASDIDKKLKQKNEELLRDFSVKNIANGAFWENEKYSKDFVVSKGVYETLISKLNEIRKKLIQTDNIFSISISEDEKVDFIHRLLVMSILIKYLEERTDDEGNTVFTKDYFSEYQLNAKTFIDVLENNGDILKLFKDLSIHFNGEVFELSDREKEIISKLDLKKFAEFFEGKTEPGIQRTIWRLYSFDDLPIELISNIYEQFLKKDYDEHDDKGKELKEQKNQAGIFYTPPFLANFLLDHLIPLTEDDDEVNIKILDPSCGSGIFLVQAYKRLIYRWKQKNEWQRPTHENLKELLTNCIYGVDIKGDAIRLTAFSLVLALCNELTPLQIWQELKFDKLKDNLYTDDFFKLIYEGRLEAKFDFIIGNPPFIKRLTPFAEKLIKRRRLKGLKSLPDNYKLSFLFLEQALEFIKDKGNICLLFPADSLLHRKSEFTDFFLKQVNVPLVIDFTPLRRTLFKSATVATVAIFYNLQKKEETVNHVIARRTKSARNELFFELDKYDFYDVAIEDAQRNKFIWKANLFGIGSRNYELLKKLNVYPKFLTYLAEKEKQNYLSRSKTAFPYLAIKKNIGGQLFYSKVIRSKAEKSEAFASEVFKIYSCSKATIYLDSIKDIFDVNKDIYKFFALNTSDRAALSRSASTILGNDIEQLPFINNLSETLTDIEKILIFDCVTFWADFIRLGENSIVLREVKVNDLIDFGDWYLKVLNSVYRSYQKGEPIHTSTHVVFPFYWGNSITIPSNISELEERIDSLLKIEIPHASLKFTRILRLYDNNIIYVIKPNQLRYWLRSIAIRDADETFAYLVKREYANGTK